MTHTSSHIMLRLFAGMLLLSTWACKKLPSELPCTCEPETPVAKKGGPPTPLAVCGTFNFRIDSTLSPLASLSIWMGYYPHGTFTPAELGPGRIFPVINIPTLQAGVDGWRWSITSANIIDFKGKTLLQVMDNKWYVYKDNVGKYNYDANGLEVYDKQGHICFSVDALSIYSQLLVQGAMNFGDNSAGYYQWPMYSDELPYFSQVDKDNYAQILQQSPIQPLFRYTGPNWQHARSGLPLPPPR